VGSTTIVGSAATTTVVDVGVAETVGSATTTVVVSTASAT
jgi:hypothetical protein